MIINGLEVFHDNDDMRGLPLNCVRININEIENTKERIEKIATRYGIEVSQVEQGKGGFIIDSSKEKHESVTDIVIDFFNDDKSEI